MIDQYIPFSNRKIADSYLEKRSFCSVNVIEKREAENTTLLSLAILLAEAEVAA